VEDDRRIRGIEPILEQLTDVMEISDASDLCEAKQPGNQVDVM
jgi:hypothetical protein